MARVNKVNGVEVYVLCEPVRKYDIVIGKGNSLQWSSFITAGLINESVATKISKFVKGVSAKAKEDGIEFDAIIYTNGKNVSAIKFTDVATPETDRMAEVQKMDGMPVYVMNEPSKAYTVESDKGPGIKWKSFVTAGLINNSIEEDIDKYAGRFKSHFKKGKIEAIVYTSGKECVGVLFKA